MQVSIQKFYFKLLNMFKFAHDRKLIYKYITGLNISLY